MLLMARSATGRTKRDALLTMLVLVTPLSAKHNKSFKDKDNAEDGAGRIAT